MAIHNTRSPHRRGSTLYLHDGGECRARLKPPFSENYFGNVVREVKAEAKAGELLEEELGWAALKLQDVVVNITDKNSRDSLDQWLQSPYTFQSGRVFGPNSIKMWSSPRFNMYGNEFGMGKAVALRSGYANKFDGNMSLFPGNEVEICLLPQNMAMLESDLEFTNAVSSSLFQRCES